MATKCIPKEIVDSIKERARNGEITADDVAKMLPEEKLALRAILEDFVAEKLGVKVSPEEIKAINEISKEIDAAYQKVGSDLGNPVKVQENVDFFKAKKKMDDYLQGKNPASKAKVVTGTIGRGMMLASVKSPVLNVGSNIEVGFTEALARRLASGQLRGTDNGLAVDYVKMANRIYQETGYDISRMMDMGEPSGAQALGETTHAQGPGQIRRVGRVVEDIVFKQLMGAPDVAFASAHFADSVNLNALRMAEGELPKAREYMRDAMRLEPKTTEGKLLKAQGVLDAQKATWTDNSWASRVSEGVRKILNDVSGDARVGDLVFPFVKTPSNVIATGMDYAGMGIPKALIDTYKAFKTGQLGEKAFRQKVSSELVRSGIGLVGAMVIASQLKDDDFVGRYDPARAQIEQLRNSNTNSIRIGNKWISTDWLGPLAVPVTAMMYARKYGNTKPEMAFQYGKGVLNAFKDLPGVREVLDYAKSEAFAKNQTLGEMVGESRDYILNEAYARMVPSILADVAKALDTYERKAKGAVETIKSKIPGLRETLPVKTNILGEPITTEPGLSVILFGSRVKSDKDNSVIKEVSRVSNAVGKGISFTNWDTSSSKQLAQFKERFGADSYQKAKAAYGAELKKRLYALMDDKYFALSDEEKLNRINALDTEAINKVFKAYGFKYKRD